MIPVPSNTKIWLAVGRTDMRKGFPGLSGLIEKGRFVWPSAKDGKIILTASQLAMLLEGIDWRILKRTWQELGAE